MAHRYSRTKTSIDGKGDEKMKMKPWLAASLAVAGLAACGQVEHHVQVGEIEVALPWSREIPPNAPVAAGFLSIRNRGSEDDRLVAIRSDAAERIEIHEVRREDGMARMRRLVDGLPLPAGSTVELKPGGYHLMFITPGSGFVAGRQVRATLVFANAGEVEVAFDVQPAAARAGNPVQPHH